MKADLAPSGSHVYVGPGSCRWSQCVFWLDGIKGPKLEASFRAFYAIQPKKHTGSIYSYQGPHTTVGSHLVLSRHSNDEQNE